MIAIGASAGWPEVLPPLLRSMPPDLPACVLVTVHLHPGGARWLVDLLSRQGTVTASVARDGEPIRYGHVFVAEEDHHLVLRADGVGVVRGPRENRSRPSIDTLFRSAAVTAGARVVGVLLTGLLADGAAGLAIVRRCGGIAVVQDPTDAPYGDMPRRALDETLVDYCLPAVEIAALLPDLVRRKARVGGDCPPDLAAEVRASATPMGAEPAIEPGPDTSTITCPDCGGVLWRRETGDGTDTHRCHVGHVWSNLALLIAHHTELERALWVALRAIEEERQLVTRMSRTAASRDFRGMASRYDERARELREHARVIRRLLTDLRPPVANA